MVKTLAISGARAQRRVHLARRRLIEAARRTRTATMSVTSFGAISAGIWDILGRGCGLIAIGVFGLYLELLGRPESERTS